jgi:RNA polymerase sigma factor (sigma-70 family)
MQMTELDDHALLAEFARSESEAAFAALVARHVPLVYSAARRFSGNHPQHAEEITQAVFIILSRKAGKLSPRTVLSGWLYQVARLTAANFVKGEIRRQRREQEAYMQSTLNEPDAAAWEQIAPLLDEAMGQLGETDRNAVVLRFFENKTAQEVGAALGLTEAAAHKRQNRALEKLRKFFTRRGVTLSAAAIAGAVSANSVQAAPVGLAVKISVVAAKGAAMGGSTLALVKGTLKTMTWFKLKFGIIGAVAFVGAATSLVVIANLHGHEVHPSRPASLLEIQQLFDLATATKPERCRFEADIELTTPPYTTEQVKASLAEIENMMSDRNARLKPQQKASLEIAQSNAIVNAHSGKRIQHVREWESGNYYRLDINDEGMGTEKFMRAHPDEYYQTWVSIPDSPFSPYASYQINRELHDMMLFKQKENRFYQYNLWRATKMNQEVAGLVVVSVMNLTNKLKPLVFDYTGLKMDASRVQQLHEQTNLTNSISIWRLEATDEELDGKAVTHFKLHESFALPPGIVFDYKPPTFQGEIWVGQISGKAVCLQEVFTNLTQHTSTLSKREKYDHDGFPMVLTTTTIKDDSSLEKQRVVFKHIEINPSFTDEEAFAPVFPPNYIVSDVSLGTGVILQNPHPEIPIAGEIGGIGITIVDRKNNEEPLMTGNVVPGSPAERAGIKSHWFLISVNGTNVVSMSLSQSMSILRGSIGTSVTIELADSTLSRTNKFIVKRGKMIFTKDKVDVVDH